MIDNEKAAPAVGAAEGGSAETLPGQENSMHFNYTTDRLTPQEKRAQRVLSVVINAAQNAHADEFFLDYNTLSCILLIPKEELMSIVAEHLNGAIIHIGRRCQEDQSGNENSKRKTG